MILVNNYNDLQNIKEKMQRKNTKNNETIFCYIKSVQDTLNFLFEKGLTINKTREDLQKEFKDFTNQLLKNTNLTYKQLETQYMSKYITTKDFYITCNSII